MIVSNCVYRLEIPKTGARWYCLNWNEVVWVALVILNSGPVFSSCSKANCRKSVPAVNSLMPLDRLTDMSSVALLAHKCVNSEPGTKKSPHYFL